MNLIDELKEKEIEFKSIKDNFNTSSSPSGKLIFHIFASLTDFERELKRERTQAGLWSARARGRKGERTKGFLTKLRPKHLPLRRFTKRANLL